MARCRSQSSRRKTSRSRRSASLCKRMRDSGPCRSNEWRRRRPMQNRLFRPGKTNCSAKPPFSTASSIWIIAGSIFRRRTSRSVGRFGSSRRALARSFPRWTAARRSRGCDLFLFADRKVGMHIIADWPSNAMKVLTSRPLPADEWSHIVATYDGSGKAAGVALYVNGEKQNVEVEIDKLNGSTATDQPFRIGMRSADSPLHAAVADVRLFQHTLEPAGSRKRCFRLRSASELKQRQTRCADRRTCEANSTNCCWRSRTTHSRSRAAKFATRSQTAQDERAKYDAAIPDGDGAGRTQGAARYVRSSSRPVRSAGQRPKSAARCAGRAAAVAGRCAATIGSASRGGS